MPELIPAPAVIEAEGTPPKTIREYFGRVNSGSDTISIAHMESPAGWSEPGQRPEFDEYTIVLRGALVVVHEQGTLRVTAGQAVLARCGEWVQYGTPDGAEYVAVCVPAFSPDCVHRDQ